MQDVDKTKAQLLQEVATLHQQLAKLSASESEHKQAKEALRESEEKYRSLVETARDVIFTLSTDGTITSVNPAFEAITRWSRAEWLGKHFARILHPDDLPLAMEFLQRALQGETLPIFELRVVSRSGGYLIGEFTATLQIQSGKVISILGIARDITGRKRMEEALRQSEARYRTVSDLVSDYAYAVRIEPDGRGVVEWVTEAFSRITGFTVQELAAAGGLARVIHPADLPRVCQRLRVLFSGQQGISEHRILTKSGEVRWLRDYSCPERDPAQGRVVRVVGAGQDITDRKEAEEALRKAYDELELRVQERTAELAAANAALQAEIAERKRAEEALRHSEEHFRLLIENALDIIILLNGDGTVRYQSPSAERLLGHKPEEAIGRSGFEFIHPDDLPHVIDAFTDTIQKPGITPPIEMRVQHRDGSWHVIETLGNNLLNNPAVAGIIINIRDITERKHMERELLQAKEAAEAANRAKSEFLASMSHELRTPLTVILGYTSLLLEQTFGNLEAEQADPLRRIDRNAQELLDLITAVLDLSRLEAGRLPVEVREVRIPKLLEELQAETQGLRERASLEFVWQVEGELPPIYTDPGKVKVVVKNLIGNAVKFTTAGSITVDAHSRSGGVEISVTDTGIGIPQEALALIFEPFRQVDASSTSHLRGTGLGLYIVKRLLELLGGAVMVESAVGRGSTFRVWIPREPAPPDC